MPVSPDATHETENIVRTWSSVARVPSELATRMRRTESAYRAVTWVMAPPCERATSSAAVSSSTLRALGTSPGRMATTLGRGALVSERATTVVPAPAPRAAAAAVRAAASRPSSVRSDVWAKPVDSPTTTLIPAPRSRPEVSSSTLPSSSSAEDERRSSTKTSANSAPLERPSASTRSTVDCSITWGPFLGCCRSWSRHRVVTGDDGVLIVQTVPVRPGLTATVDLTVTEEDTALAMRTGVVPVIATPRIVALFEEAAVLAVHDQLDEGSSTVGVSVQMEHVAPVGVGGKVLTEATLDKVEGRRLSFRVSARDDRGLVAAGRVVRVVVDVEAFLDKTR